MKNNIFKLLFISLSVVLLLTGCDTEDDEYWVESTLDAKFSCRSDGNGYFTDTPITLTLADLKNINIARDDIYDMQLIYNSIELLSTFYRGDIIDRLTISVNGVGSFICPTYVFDGDRNNLTLDESIAPGYNRFMDEVMRKFLQTGSITLYVSGYLNAYNVYIDVNLYNDLDVLVRN